MLAKYNVAMITREIPLLPFKSKNRLFHAREMLADFAAESLAFSLGD